MIVKKYAQYSMISAIFLCNRKGDIVISRIYRDEISLTAINSFRSSVIAAKETGSKPPVRSIDGHTFLYIRVGEMFLVAVSRSNLNAAMTLAFESALVEIFKGYFGPKLTEDMIRNNFSLVYELLDEVLDFGHPQTTALETLRLFINLGEVKGPETAEEHAKMTSAITGARDWRREGIVHKENEVFVDVLEEVNLLVSAQGNALRSDVTGKVLMRTKLTGMPECRLTLNDKLALASGSAGGSAVDIEDVSFHRCVQLSKFDADRSITFVPPDGEFELMRYRITDNIKQPFRLIPVIEEQGDTRVVMNVKVIANFASKHQATNVTFTFPVPHNYARAIITVPTGRAQYVPAKKAIVWRIRRFPGSSELTFSADCELIPSTKKKAWVRPPIAADFTVPMLPASGISIRTLRIFERSGYEAAKWVRYLTRSGVYQVRI